MKTTVIGGGNIGTLMAAEMAAKGYEVTLYTSKPQCFNKQIDVYDSEEHLLLSGQLKKFTSDMQEALEGADIVWITMPAQTFSQLAEKLLPHVRSGMYIGVVPGSGGAEFTFHRLIAAGCILFGLQRVHSIARLKEYGKSVYMLGRKSSLEIGTIPTHFSSKLCATIEKLFDMPCTALPNYLSVTLTPSNPILHTTRLYAMFRDYEKGKIYPKNYLFYEEWDLESSKWLLACDDELQKICNAIPLELSVLSLRDYYESYDEESMTAKIKSIQAFRGLTSPMTQTLKGWTIDFESRYFTTDFPYGLKIIRDIGILFKIPTPHMDTVWEWFSNTVEPPCKQVLHMDLCQHDFLKLYD